MSGQQSKGITKAASGSTRMLIFNSFDSSEEIASETISGCFDA